MSKAYRCYTFYGSDENHGEYMAKNREESTPKKKGGHFTILKDTLLFAISTGMVTDEGDTFWDVLPVNSREGRTASGVHVTFHDAIASVRTGKNVKNVRLYVIAATRNVYVAIQRNKSRIKNLARKGSTKSQKPIKLLIETDDLADFNVIYSMQLPLGDSGFPNGIFSEIESGNFPLVTAMQKGAGDSTYAFLKKEYKVLKDTVAFFSLSQTQHLPGISRVIKPNDQQFRTMVAPDMDLAGDHHRFFQLCESAHDKRNCKGAALYALARGVGPWPNRPLIWVESRSAHHTAGNPSAFNLEVHNAKGTQYFSVFTDAMYPVGFVVLELSPVEPKQPRVHMELIGAHGRNGAERVVAFVLFTMMHAALANGDLLRVEEDRLLFGEGASKALLSAAVRPTQQIPDFSAAIEATLPYVTQKTFAMPSIVKIWTDMVPIPDGYFCPLEVKLDWLCNRLGGLVPAEHSNRKIDITDWGNEE